MAGRLEKYDDFIELASTLKSEEPSSRPPRTEKEKHDAAELLESASGDAAILESRRNHLECMIFYRKRLSNGRLYGKYEVAVIPERPLSRKGVGYLEIIDVLALKRKTLRRDRIASVHLTGRKFDGNQSLIGYK